MTKHTEPVADWQLWWAWYPVCSIDWGWVWMAWVIRKPIPQGYVDPRDPNAKHFGEEFSQKLTGRWYRGDTWS